MPVSQAAGSWAGLRGRHQQLQAHLGLERRRAVWKQDSYGKNCLLQFIKRAFPIPALHVSADGPAAVAVLGSPDSAFLCCPSAVSSSHQGLSKEQLVLQVAHSSHLHHEMREHRRGVLPNHHAAALAQLITRPRVAECAAGTGAQGNPGVLRLSCFSAPDSSQMKT